MKKVLTLVCSLLCFQAQGSREMTFICSEGDYFISLQVSTSRQSIKAGICEFAVCQTMDTVGQKNPVDSEGYMKTYVLNGDEKSILTIAFDAESHVSAVEKSQDGFPIQYFSQCTSR